MRPPNVALRIDELVLHGFAPGDRQRIAAAVQREMTRLVAAGGVPQAWTASPPALRGQPLAAPHGAGPHAIGAAIARSVYGGLPR
jgi:hypothetical protein